MELFMKTAHYFLLFFIIAALTNTHLNAMEETIELICYQGDNPIKVPIRIVQHSLTLKSKLEKDSLSLVHSTPFVVSDQVTLQRIVDCLNIIDSEKDVECRLLDYMRDIATPQERTKLFDAAEILKIQKFVEVTEVYTNSVLKNLSDHHEQGLDKVLKRAKAVFTKVKDKANSAIIIDVDDTALSLTKSLGNIIVNGVWRGAVYFPAHDKVRDLYKYVVKLGFKIFFLTARVEKTSPDVTYLDRYEATIFNLKNEGYTVFERVICVPYETRAQIKKQADGDNTVFNSLIAQWKESERNKIAEQFRVVGL